MYKYRGNENILSEKKVQMKQGQYRGVKYFSSNEKKLKMLVIENYIEAKHNNSNTSQLKGD